MSALWGQACPLVPGEGDIDFGIREATRKATQGVSGGLVTVFVGISSERQGSVQKQSKRDVPASRHHQRRYLISSNFDMNEYLYSIVTVQF